MCAAVKLQRCGATRELSFNTKVLGTTLPVTTPEQIDTIKPALLNLPDAKGTPRVLTVDHFAVLRVPHGGILLHSNQHTPV